MLAFLEVPLSWGQIFKRTFNEAVFKDNTLGMAAQLAYYFFFALFPALLFLLAVASYFPVERLVDDIVTRMSGFAPPEVISIITDQIRKISQGESSGLLTFGMLVTIWSSSAAMTAIIDTVNRAYDIDEGRPWWKVRLTAIGLTIGVSLFILVSFALLTVGPTLAERYAAMMGLGPVFEWTWKILQWPLIFALVTTAMAAIYYWGPDAEQDWVWLTPGSLLATTLWLLASFALKYYLANFGNYTETYGFIGGVMILLLWFYVTGLVILFGAELNAEIEHASPYGKDEGEKVPGEKKKLGVARMRAWMARRRHGPPHHAAGAPAAVGPERRVGNWPPAHVVAMSDTRHQLPPARRFSDWLIGLGVVGAQVYWAAKSFRSKRRA